MTTKRNNAADALIVLEIMGGFFINEADEKLKEENISEKEREMATRLKSYLENVTIVLKTINEAYAKAVEISDLAKEVEKTDLNC
ncbi:MAG TPA: hypothetical protein PLS84_03165 [Salinivirgaceae bacterium]|nr:hypothetical protein [Salinivirgaceae bacterium]